MYFPNPSDLIQAIDAATGDLHVGVPALAARRTSATTSRCRPSIATSRSTATRSSTRAPTTIVYALDARTGKLAWETKIFDYQHGAQQTSGPIIANGKVISGRGCEPEGSPGACVITAHDAQTGKRALAHGARSRPRRARTARSWGDMPDARSAGTSARWMVPSYDPELNLVFVGTSVTSPAPKFALAGNDKKYLYHNSTLALNADTGEIVWYYQHIVDHWDLDHPFERMLVDTAVAPDRERGHVDQSARAPRRAAQGRHGHPGQDRASSTRSIARPASSCGRGPRCSRTCCRGSTARTGEVTVNPETLFVEIGQERLVCPTALGGKNWPSGTYSPLRQRRCSSRCRTPA